MSEKSAAVPTPAREDRASQRTAQTVPAPRRSHADADDGSRTREAVRTGAADHGYAPARYALEPLPALRRPARPCVPRLPRRPALTCNWTAPTARLVFRRLRRGPGRLLVHVHAPLRVHAELPHGRSAPFLAARRVADPFSPKANAESLSARDRSTRC